MTSTPDNVNSPWLDQAPTGREWRVSKDDFSMDVVHFIDNRPPRLHDSWDETKYIYQYDSDRLLHGVNHYVPAMLEKYVGYKPKMPKHYKVEIELRELTADIKTGSFWSGSWGRYDTNVEMMVLARRSDSAVVSRKLYRLHLEDARTSVSGRGPAKDTDRDILLGMVEKSLRKISEQVAWNIRNDARKWDLAAGQPEMIKIEKRPSAPGMQVETPAVVEGNPDAR